MLKNLGMVKRCKRLTRSLFYRNNWRWMQSAIVQNKKAIYSTKNSVHISICTLHSSVKCNAFVLILFIFIYGQHKLYCPCNEFSNARCSTNLLVEFTKCLFCNAYFPKVFALQIGNYHFILCTTVLCGMQKLK